MSPRLEEVRFARLLDAMVAVAGGLRLPDVLHQIVESACQLVDARYGALGVVGTQGRLVEFVTSGVSDETTREIGDPPEGHGILGLLIVDPKPLRLRDLTRHPKFYGFPGHHPQMRSFLGVPLRIGEAVFGNLYLCEKQQGEEFTTEDEALVVALAAIAGVAVENSQLHGRLRDLAVMTDRERIARDLHDTVIQRLFAAGMGLQAVTRKIDGDAAHRVAETIDELDAIIDEIRSTIFELKLPRLARQSLSASVLQLVDDMIRTTTIEPTVHIDGALDRRVDGGLGDDLLVALREALANVVKHSGAGSVTVAITVDGNLTLRVEDDGRGIDLEATPSIWSRHGLRNLESRTRGRSGRLTIEPGEERGARLVWEVPLTD